LPEEEIMYHNELLVPNDETGEVIEEVPSRLK
jgi:hypothetical protein